MHEQHHCSVMVSTSATIKELQREMVRGERDMLRHLRRKLDLTDAEIAEHFTAGAWTLLRPGETSDSYVTFLLTYKPRPQD